MKYFKIPLLFCFCLVLNSCDEDDILDFFEDPEVDVNVNFVVPVQINSPTLSFPTQRVEFARTGAYDVLAHPQVAEEIGEPERIKKVVINSITYEFINFSGNVDAEVEGELRFPIGPLTEDNFYMPSVIAAESDLFGTVYTINGNFENVNAYITNSKFVEFTYRGAATHNPVNFTLQVIINATVTVELNLDDL